MRSQLLREADGQRTFVVVFESGDEVSQGLLDFAKTQDLRGSRFTAIGAFRDVVFTPPATGRRADRAGTYRTAGRLM